jgi:hypothetical protein
MKCQPWPPPTLDVWADGVKANPQPLWWVEKLLPADAITLVSGPAKLGRKTLAVCQMMRCLATAKSGPGMKVMRTEPCDILALEYEGPALPLALSWDWLDNAAGWSADRSRIRWAHRYAHVSITSPEWADAVSKLMREERRKGLVIDTFTRAAMAHENDAIALNEAFKVLDRIRNESEGGWVVYIHHLRKSGDPWDEDIDQQVRGNTAFSGAYDHHLAFRAGHTDDTVHLYTRSKIDHDRFFRCHWTISDVDEKISLAITEFELADPPPAGLVRECVELLQDASVKTMRQLAEAWDVQRAVAEWLCDAMCDAGMLERTARGFRRV